MPTWYLRVKTLDAERQIDLGSDERVARAALAEGKKLMEETGAVTIGGGLVVNASDIVALSLHLSGDG